MMRDFLEKHNNKINEAQARDIIDRCLKFGLVAEPFCPNHSEQAKPCVAVPSGRGCALIAYRCTP